jgi:hypothetical protein
MAAETPEPFATLLPRVLVRDPEGGRITMREVAETLLGALETPAGSFPEPIDLPQVIV